MTSKRTSDAPATPAKARKANPTAKAAKDDKAADGFATPISERDAAATKASVHEAIGKLIGDDDERRRGAAKKKASGTPPDKPGKPSGS